MRLFFLLCMFCSSLFVLAQTDEVDLEEEPEVFDPYKRSLVPLPRVTITDRVCVIIEPSTPYSSIHIVVEETSSSAIILDECGSIQCYFLEPLQIGKIYSISLYIEDHHYIATYKP